MANSFVMNLVPLRVEVSESAEKLKMLGYEGSSYTLYEDDGIHKDYDKKENYRVLTK